MLFFAFFFNWADKPRRKTPDHDLASALPAAAACIFFFASSKQQPFPKSNPLPDSPQIRDEWRRAYSKFKPGPRVLAEVDGRVNDGRLFLFALRPDQLQQLAAIFQEHVADNAEPE